MYVCLSCNVFFPRDRLATKAYHEMKCSDKSHTGSPQVDAFIDLLRDPTKAVRAQDVPLHLQPFLRWMMHCSFVVPRNDLVGCIRFNYEFDEIDCDEDHLIHFSQIGGGPPMPTATLWREACEVMNPPPPLATEPGLCVEVKKLCDRMLPDIYSAVMLKSADGEEVGQMYGLYNEESISVVVLDELDNVVDEIKYVKVVTEKDLFIRCAYCGTMH